MLNSFLVFPLIDICNLIMGKLIIITQTLGRSLKSIPPFDYLIFLIIWPFNMICSYRSVISVTYWICKINFFCFLSLFFFLFSSVMSQPLFLSLASLKLLSTTGLYINSDNLWTSVNHRLRRTMNVDDRSCVDPCQTSPSPSSSHQLRHATLTYSLLSVVAVVCWGSAMGVDDCHSI